MKATPISVLRSRAAGYLSAVLAITAVTSIGAPFHDRLNNTTVALALLLVVLFVAMLWGIWPGRAAAVLGVLCFNFFFLPPIYTFTIADPQNWVALAAFFVTASTVGHLSTRERQRAAEAESGRKEARLASAYNRSLIEASLDPLVAIGPEGKITDVNAATENATGHSRAELIGTDFSDYFTAPEMARAGYQQVFREGLVRDYPLELRHRGGYVTPVLYNASVYRDDSGQVNGVLAAARDITERRRAEEELKKSAEEIRTLNADLEQRVIVRTAELQATNKVKDELILRERAITTELEQAREREVEIGFKIQQTLLLDQPPGDVPGLQVAALTVPSQRIDGDFYIFIRHPNQCLDVIVGDVMGKGVPAALVGAATKSHFLKALSDLMALSKDGRLPEPREVVMLAHAGVARHLIELESFVTLCYARLDVSRRNLVFVDCGHTGIAHLHTTTGVCEMLHGNNLPMGVREGEIYDQIPVPFEPGDLFLLYSDGITEAHNSVRELFGMERLEECIRMNGHLEPLAFVETLRKAVFTFSQSDRLGDDLTSVAIRVEEVRLPLTRAEIDIHSDLVHLHRAREFVRAFCRNLPGLPLDDDSRDALELAVNEAASNIMKHAYHGRGDQWIHLEGESFPGHVSIRLRHLGDPFDPAAAPPPVLDGSRESGRGAYIIAQSVDEVRYYRDERGRNCVALVKKRKS